MSFYLHVARDYDRVLENTFGVLKKPGKVPEFILGRTMGTLQYYYNIYQCFVECTLYFYGSLQPQKTNGTFGASELLNFRRYHVVISVLSSTEI